MVHLLTVVSGLAALLCTVALVSIDLVLAVQAGPGSQVRASATASAVLETLVWAIIATSLSSLFFKSAPTFLSNWSPRRRSIKFGICVLLIISGTAASLANIICLNQVSEKNNREAFNGSKRVFVLNLSVFMAMAVVFQLAFIAMYFLIIRRLSVDENSSLHSEGYSSKLSLKLRVKAVPYDRTRPTKSEKLETNSFESSTEFSTISRPPSAAIVSPRSSMSQTIRTVSSKTRLLPTRDMRRSPSVESTSSRRWESDDHSDLGDGASLEMGRNNRGMKRENSVSAYGPPRSLAPIPASPTVNDTPVFGTPGDLELPPPIHARGRSNSDGSVRGSIRASSPCGSVESAELHIHPLFRSDSPTPPPLASPGTSVFSAPNAGMVLPRRASNQSLKRIRSSSLISNSSPLAQSSTFEAAPQRKPIDEQQSIREVEEETDLASPIPMFVLNAGGR
ncbi:unnamed protein product [Clonostachys rhizophaga]|uniref:Uncharacterized protein n=1 Tax=Clonostachys rhizophaga TaxID=160324 RepID=A0A9N9YK44_9HYPO|nr:unnamed protein product [Clonostachys rhizophaga]